MSGAEGLPVVAVAEVRRFTGAATFDRAEPYVLDGSLSQLDWDARDRVLTGRVQGSDPTPYRCTVFLSDDDGTWAVASSTCSCPVGTRCTHAAALLLVSSRLGRGTSSRNPLRPAPPAGTAPAPRGASEWRRVLTRHAARPSAHPPGRGAQRPLALQFEVRERVRRSLGRWGHANETTQAATADSSGLLVVTLRIASPGTRGWIAADTDWSKIGYDLSGYLHDPQQARWFGEFAAVARASQPRYIGQDAKRLVLEEFESPLLWRLLDDARERGIELVGFQGSVVRARSASVVGRLEENARGGDLRVRADARFDGSSGADSAVASIAVIGQHGLVSVEWRGLRESVIRLGPLTTQLSAESCALLSAGELLIPHDDRSEFFADYYPRLSGVVFDAVAPDDVPAIEPPTRVLTVTAPSATEPAVAPPAATAKRAHGQSHELKLSWAWDGGRRDAAAEAGIDREITRVLSGFVEQGIDYPTTTTLFDVDAADFVERVLPELEQIEGVRVDAVGARPHYRELTDAPKLTVRAVQSDGRDWLELGFTVTVGDVTVPFAPLFTALAAGKARLLLVDGSHLSLNRPEFDRLRELIAEAGERKEWEGGTLRLHRTQVGLWREVEDVVEDSPAASGWRAQVRALTDAPTTTPALPPGFTAELREYQRQGYAWLSYLYDNGLGGILADDMGLGKTVQTLALIAAKRAHDPWLVVAPASVVPNWVDEAARFAPALRVASVTRTQGKEKTKLRELARDHDVIITSYHLFRHDFGAIDEMAWAGLVLDEAQFVKNHRSRAHECATSLRAPFKLAVTGTPMENDVLELWSIIDIVAPGLFPSLRRFTEQYVRPLNHVREPDAVPAGISRADARRLIERLRSRIRPFLLRRTKALVAPELPEKQEQVLRVELHLAHRRLYEQFLQRERQKLLGLVKEDVDRQRFILFRSLTLLRMLALDAELIDPELAGTPSAKLDALLEQLDEVVAGGHRALVFSQFTSFLHLVEKRLDAEGIAYEYLDGSTVDRASVIARFKGGDAPVFLISLKAGGFGLNLTEADYVFLLDPWWNPAAEAQAVDRTHRIGQTSPVNVYRLVADGTIEDKVMKLRDEKAELFGQVLDDGEGGFSETLSADDIRGLLEL